MNNEDIYIGKRGEECDDYENTILITLKDTNNLVKILYDKIVLLENENSKFKKQMYYLNKNLIELKDNNVKLTNKIEQNGTINTINGTINTINGTVNTANGTVNTANGTVNTANGTVNTANGTTNTANGTVNTANGTVNTANDTDLNDFIINSVNEYNFEPNIDNNESVINESDIINEINFISKADKKSDNKKSDNKKSDNKDKEDRENDNKDYIKNKLKKLIIETQQNAININKRKKNMLFTMR
jgi:hypothetical protein